MGGWAGVSLADPRTFIEYGVKSKILSKELAEEINSFYWELIPGIYGSEPVSEEFLERVQVIALDIMRQLKQISKGPYGP